MPIAAPAVARGDAQPSMFSVADQTCKVLANRRVNARYKHLVLEADAPAIAARPGQFFHILCTAGGEGPFLRRPMSVFGTDRKAGRVEFLYHVTGRGTRVLATLEPGDTISIVGPLGVGFRLDPAWRRILVLARGVGLATLAPVAAWAADQGVAVRAVLSARSAEDLMAREFAGRGGAQIDAVFDSDGSSDVAEVEALLRSLIERKRPDAVFTCGSNRLLLVLKKLARDYGIPGQVALEQQMGCGLGMCFACVRALEIDGQVVHRRVCTEGPVFDLAQALSW